MQLRRNDMKTCHNCNNLIEDDINYCPFCGSSQMNNEPSNDVPEPVANEPVQVNNVSEPMQQNDMPEPVITEPVQQDDMPEPVVTEPIQQNDTADPSFNNSSDAQDIPEPVYNEATGSYGTAPQSNDQKIVNTDALKNKISGLKDMPPKKKKMAAIIGGGVLLAIILIIVLSFTVFNKGGSSSGGSSGGGYESDLRAKLRSAYQGCTSSHSYLASDASSLTINGEDKYDTEAASDAFHVLNALGMPSYIKDEIEGTNSLMGRQRESANGYTVSWTYHPDNGLDIIFRVNE